MQKPRLVITHRSGGERPEVVLREVIGDHYDIEIDEQPIEVYGELITYPDGEVVTDPVIRICRKGETEPLLSFWVEHEP